MAMTIVPSACQIQPDGSKGVIVVESDYVGPDFSKAIDELSSVEGRNAAMWYARQHCGISPAHLNGNVIGPYPVNSQGLSLETVRGPNGEELPQTHTLMQPAKYRVDVPVVRPV